MSYSPSVIERLQLDMGAIVQACPDLATVSMNILRPRASTTAVMIQTAIDQSLQGLVTTNGKTGATILINMPEGEVPYPEAPGPDLRLVCKVQIVENPLINMGANGTGISAEDIMLFVLNLFHGRFWQDSGSTMKADKDATRPLLQYLEKSYVAYECRFVMRLGLQGRLKTAMPAIQGDSISGYTFLVPQGAWVIYTTDGSYPTPTNGTRWNPPLLIDPGAESLVVDPSEDELLIDSAPIFPATGTLVRYVAYQNNNQASDLAAKIIS